MTGVLRNTESVTAGTGAPFAVGVPPVQLRTMSPASSVTPSERAESGTGVPALHEAGLAAPATAGRRSPNAPAATTIPNVHLKPMAFPNSL